MTQIGGALAERGGYPRWRARSEDSQRDMHFGRQRRQKQSRGRKKFRQCGDTLGDALYTRRKWYLCWAWFFSVSLYAAGKPWGPGAQIRKCFVSLPKMICRISLGNASSGLYMLFGIPAFMAKLITASLSIRHMEFVTYWSFSGSCSSLARLDYSLLGSLEGSHLQLCATHCGHAWSAAI